MKRQEKVFDALQTLENAGSQSGFTTLEIAEKAHITRSNCSGELNELCRLGRIYKLPGRPTRYRLSEATQLVVDDAFSHVVGAARSLSEAVRLAKAAIGYPPLGMHVLILGEAGVGKSTFAKTMHTYAIEQDRLRKGAPFITFNCAEYANNPEILLDHVFGHVRGAYTGAESDKPGLIELVDQGVLFLDEIHRLPPQGQEMLFHWLDTGEFQRMGEAAAHRQSKAMLIAATTEMDESVLLLTFRRRIPVTIKLPALREWSIYDRYELIYRCLYEEAQTLKACIRLTGEAVDRLLFAHLPGNVGGLRNAMKLACAQAYAQNNGRDELVVDERFVQLGDVAGNVSFVTGVMKERVKDVWVTPFESPGPITTSIFENSLYYHLTKLGEQLQHIGLANEEIVIAIERELMRRQFAQSANPSLTELKRLVGEAFYEGMRRCWSVIAQRLSPETMDAAFIRVSTHLSETLRESQSSHNGVDTAVFEHVGEEYPDLYAIAQRLVMQFNVEFHTELPDYEVALIALLLKPDVQKALCQIGLVLVLQGDAIATQMAQTIAHIDVNARLISVDVPLETDTDFMLDQFTAATDLADVGAGVLVMTDIPIIRQWVLERPHVACVFRPDLTTVMQVVLRIETHQGDVFQLRDMVVQGNNIDMGKPLIGDRYKIWTCCMTGRGSAVALKRFLEKELPEPLRERIEIVPVEVSQQGVANAETASDLIAMVGSVRPNVLDIPFFSIEQILAPQGMNRLIKTIYHMQVLPDEHLVEDPKGKSTDMMTYVKNMLDHELLLVNPTVAMQAAKEAMEVLRVRLPREFDEAWYARFSIHMACAIERIVRGESMEHPDQQIMMTHHRDVLNVVKEALKAYEMLFHIEMSLGEMAYICNMVM